MPLGLRAHAAVLLLFLCSFACSLFSQVKNEVQGRAKGTAGKVAATRGSLDMRSSATSVQADVWTLSGLQLKHMYLDEVVTVDLEVKMGGVNETALYVMTVSQATGPAAPPLCMWQGH